MESTKNKPNEPNRVETASGNLWRCKEEDGKNVLHLFAYGSVMSCIGKRESYFDVVKMPSHEDTVCNICMSMATAGDFVVKEVFINNERKYKFPTLGVCGTGCGGYTMFYWRGLSVKDPEKTLHMALLQHGLSMRHWDNSPPSQKCDCGLVKLEMGELLTRLNMVADTNWHASGGSAFRGITDYVRTITFNDSLSSEDYDMLKEFVNRFDNPGYCNKHVVEQKPGMYVFHSTMDSSD